MLEVKSKKKGFKCHKCGKYATKHDGYAPTIEVRHLPILDTPVYLKIKPVCYKCEYCDNNPTTTEQYDWCDKRANITRILRKQHECLTEVDKSKLRILYRYSPILKKAHSYALKLTHIFNKHTNRKLVVSKINRWISKLERSNLSCFDKFIDSLKQYKSGIANYFKKRRNSGLLEGLNNMIKVIKRRCYGFFKTESLFQRLFLDLRGYQLYGS